MLKLLLSYVSIDIKQNSKVGNITLNLAIFCKIFTKFGFQNYQCQKTRLAANEKKNVQILQELS